MATIFLKAAEARRLVEATHGDPFSVLGMHVVEGARVVVRALLPGAHQVDVLDASGALRGTLHATRPALLFEGEIAGTAQPFAYRLRVHDAQGRVETIEDAYRFGPLVGAQDLYYLAEGTHLRPWEVLGGRPATHEGVAGSRFVVWAPNATRVAVLGDFNAWDNRPHAMRLRHDAGLWEIFLPGVGAGARYKLEILARDGRRLPLKADPYACAAELRPATASVVAPPPPSRPLPAGRAQANGRAAPISIYEVHLGSWRRTADGRFLDWETLARELPAYAAELGFTHIELLPVSEHPFDGSWGYQTLGLFAPTARFGDPADLARLIDACHERGLGVILDWVPAHFPTDEHGLRQFDGTSLYEYADPREGVHRDWNTLVYNYGRTEVRNFLIGSALYWLECWGVDGLRVDAVASMLYRDYSRPAGEWVPNVHGGHENLEAVSFLKRLNEIVGAEAQGAITVAEESTAWPAVTRPTSTGGLGFHYKWNMGWMHDTLEYLRKDPVHRRWHHNELTFSLVYAFSENYVLPLSHDEVVHGKGSLLGKMPGDRWRRFANLRALFGYMWTHPGKKLLFMGGEFAQEREWDHDRALDWPLLEHAEHRGIQSLVRDLNRMYRAQPALHALDCEAAGFEWIDGGDAEHSVLVYLRHDGRGGSLLVACNFTPVPRHGLRIGVPTPCAWREILNTDSTYYGGTNLGNGPHPCAAEPVAAHGRAQSIVVTLGPLATVVFEPA